MVERNDPRVLDGVPQSPAPMAADTAVSTPRRRFVKGASLALPAIVTLQYSGATAAVSVTCVEKNATANPPLPLPAAAAIVSATDGYERESVLTYQRALDGVKIYLDGHQSNVYRKVSDGSIIDYTPTIPPDTQLANYYALVYRDKFAVIKADGPTAGAAWNSFTCLNSLGL